MEQKKSSNKGFWLGVTGIMLAVTVAVCGFNYCASYGFEQVESYFLYTHTPQMQESETFYGIRMDELGRIEYIEADDEASAIVAADAKVKKEIEKYQLRPSDDTEDKRTFKVWHQRNDYTLFAVRHTRNISPETVLDLIGEGNYNIYILMRSMEESGFKFRIVKDDFGEQ